MKTAIRITEADYASLRQTLLRDAPEESAAFLLAGRVRAGDTETILVRRIVPIPREEYRFKGPLHLDISPRAINGLIALCEANGLGAVLCHSHPGHGPRLDYSPTDDHGERRIAAALQQAVPGCPVGSILISEDGIRARRWDKGRATPVDEVVIIGNAIRRLDVRGGATGVAVDAEVFSRQVLAFGEEGQAAIARTKVAIVGVGGTGSPLAEMLVRMGVQDLLLIDEDSFSPSNLTRVYGSYARHAKLKNTPKVKVVGRHLRRIAPSLALSVAQGNIVAAENAARLRDRDIVFLCTDEMWGRSLLNQLCHQYLIPGINLGIRIDAKDSHLVGGTGIVHVLRPGRPCLWCYEYLRADVIRAESLPPGERQNLAREKYVVGLDSQAPAVASVTTTVAGLAANQFLQLVTGFMGPDERVDCLRLDVLESDVRRATAPIKPGCVCGKVAGFGDMRALPVCEDAELLRDIRRARTSRGA